MSAADAAGWALSSAQSVSVVPMIQCRPHGMTNSTDFSVRRIRPESPRIRSRGHDQVDALARADVELAALARQRLRVVGPHPGGVDHLLGADADRRPRLLVVHHRTDHPLAFAQQPDDPRPVGHVRAVRGRGAGEEHGVPRVVDLGVVVLQRADQRVLAQRRHHPQSAVPGEVPVVGHAARPPGEQRERVVERDARARVEPLPPAVLAAGRGTAPAAPGAGRACRSAARAPPAPRRPAGSRASPGSAGRRG